MKTPFCHSKANAAWCGVKWRAVQGPREEGGGDAYLGPEKGVAPVLRVIIIYSDRKHTLRHSESSVFIVPNSTLKSQETLQILPLESMTTHQKI